MAALSAKALASTWSDSGLTRLSRCIVDWESIAPVLSITEAEEREIKEDSPHDYQMQKYVMLRKWKAKVGDGATYGQLIRVFRSMREMVLVEHVHKILLHPEQPATASNVLACYQEFLQRSYSKTPHPSLLPDQWPIMKKPVFVGLSLETEERSTNPLQSKMVSVSLSDLFVTTKPKMTSDHHRVLLCGLPGSGKTTLTWHVSQLWAKKELFQQFTLLLTVPLRSRQVQQATCLADLIPHPNQEQKRAIAQALTNTHGDGVCFWFDGWDELPEEIQKQSFVASFIRQDALQSSLPGCTIAVTSRSERRFLNESVVRIDSLNQAQVEEMVTKNTEGTDRNANELLTALESKAALNRLCSLPITVTILIHLFLTFGDNIPTTQTELFRCLILNLLLRNLQTRWLLPVKTLENFDSLPEFANKCFHFLCKLAYDGVMQSKAVFRPSDIPNLQLPLSLATLGLMKINPHIEWFGIDEELTFIHSTIQEFLAAYHLSSLSSAQQVCDLKKIRKSQHLPVIVFFGGLTKFSGTKDYFPPRQKHYVVDETDDWFFTLVESLYEAQTPRLCHIVPKEKDSNWTIAIDINMIRPLSHVTLAQMVPLGYFIAHLCSKETCTLSLFSCLNSERVVNFFVTTILSEWATLIPKPAKPNFTLTISDNYMCQATKAISQLIANTNLLRSLRLFVHMSVLVIPWKTPTLFISPPPDYYLDLPQQIRMPGTYEHVPDRRLCLHSVMRPLISSLSRNSSMVELAIKFRFPSDYEMPLSALIAYSEYYMVLLFTCCHGLSELILKKLFQQYHPYHLLSAAMRYNKNIQWLNLEENVSLMRTKPSLKNLALAIGMNRTVKGISLVESLSNESLLCLLKNLLKHGSLLGSMVIDIEPSSEVIAVLEKLNDTRFWSEKSPLNICYKYKGLRLFYN